MSEAARSVAPSQQEPAPAPRRGRWCSVGLQALIAVVVAAAIYLGYAWGFGAELGQLCDTAAECRWSGLGHRVCLHDYWGYCTTPCGSDTDCPPRWWCEIKNPQGPVCRKPPKR